MQEKLHHGCNFFALLLPKIWYTVVGFQRNAGMYVKNQPYALRTPHNKAAFSAGLRDGTPIGLGYLAVSFSLGIAVKNAGLSWFQGFLASWLCTTSTGEYAVFSLMAAGTTILEVAFVTLIINARYLLMSCAISQRVDPAMPFWHRFAVAFHLTDELFGIAIARNGKLNPYYSYGAFLTAVPGWAVGTALGTVVGSVLPPCLVSAMSVALYGMFIALFVPPARQNRVIGGIVVVCFAASFASVTLPVIRDLSEGMRIILLTLILASAAALLFPRHDSEEEVAE